MLIRCWGKESFNEFFSYNITLDFLVVIFVNNINIKNTFMCSVACDKLILL